MEGRYWRAAEAEQVVEAWGRSGQSGAAFARAQGLSRARLMRWRDRLKRSTAPVFHPVRVVERAEPPAIPGAGPLQLELRGGRGVGGRAGFGPELHAGLAGTAGGFG